MTSWSSITQLSRQESCDGNESDGVYSSIVVYDALRVDSIGQVGGIVTRSAITTVPSVLPILSRQVMLLS